MNIDSAWIDPQLVPILKNMVEQLRKTAAPGERPMEEARKNFTEGQKHWNENGPLLPMVEDKSAPGPFKAVKVRHYHPLNETDARPFLVFFHGGGWVVGNPDTSDYLCRVLAKESGIDILSVDYGLAPEQHFPETVEECLGVVSWLKRQGSSWGLDSQRIAVGGDSAGANLALAVALSLRDRGEMWLKMGLLFYAALTPESASESRARFGHGEYGMTLDQYQWFWKNYLPDPSQSKNPLAVPLYADLKGLPPLFLASAALDPLLDDTLSLSRLLESAGVVRECRVYPGMIHGFLQFIREVGTSRQAALDAAHALRRVLLRGDTLDGSGFFQSG